MVERAIIDECLEALFLQYNNMQGVLGKTWKEFEANCTTDLPPRLIKACGQLITQLPEHKPTLQEVTHHVGKIMGHIWSAPTSLTDVSQFIYNNYDKMKGRSKPTPIRKDTQFYMGHR